MGVTPPFDGHMTLLTTLSTSCGINQRRLEVWLDHVVAQRAARAACTGMSDCARGTGERRSFFMWPPEYIASCCTMHIGARVTDVP